MGTNKLYSSTMRWRDEAVQLRAAVVILIGINVVLVWSISVLPGQDLPQHLSYVRILADYTRPELPFARMYSLPEAFQPYHATYHLLALLARVSSAEAAARALVTLYVVAFSLSFIFLARCARPAGEPLGWEALLAAPLTWNPVFCMGFLPFLVCIPLFVLGCGCLLRWSRDGSPAWGGCAAASAAVCGSLHPVAGGALGLFAAVHALLAAGQRRRALTVLGCALVTLAVWHAHGAAPRNTLTGAAVEQALRDSIGLDFLDSLLRITWYDPLVTAGYVAWTVLGPFSWTSDLIVAGGGGALLWSLRARLSGGAPRKTTLVFFIVACLLPWGFYRPSEITFLNFRLITLAVVLLAAQLRMPAPSARARAAMVLFVCAWTGWFWLNAFRFAGDARQVRSLLRQVPCDHTLTPLVFTQRSAGFGKLFRMSHFLSMYFTVDEAGISTQFWAGYTEHLPIAYRAGAAPATPADWSPWTADPSSLVADDVLVAAATGDDSVAAIAGSERVTRALSQMARSSSCVPGWCLYHLR